VGSAQPFSYSLLPAHFFFNSLSVLPPLQLLRSHAAYSQMIFPLSS